MTIVFFQRTQKKCIVSPLFKRAKDLSQANQSIDDFVGLAQRDVNTGFLFDHEFPHQDNVPLCDGPGFEGFINGVGGIMFFN